jgi:hypothetical protein
MPARPSAGGAMGGGVVACGERNSGSSLRRAAQYRPMAAPRAAPAGALQLRSPCQWQARLVRILKAPLHSSAFVALTPH